ncbi:hypothetical protein Hanom_Chr10g00925621 [Helianthus anomalus]
MKPVTEEPTKAFEVDADATKDDGNDAGKDVGPVPVKVKPWWKKVVLLRGSRVGDDGCLCLGRSPLF